MDMEAFFRLHDGLPREGPGDPADVARAARAVGARPVSRVADMGAGPGGDTGLLLASFPEALVTAVDAHPPFIEALRARYPKEPRLTAIAGDMALVDGPFDLIWCAGALYFLGLDAGLATLRDKLAPGGVLAFSHPCHFTDTPSPEALAFWAGEDATVGTRPALLAAVARAGFTVLDDWPVSEAGWTLYYAPLMARIAALREGADAALAKVLDENEAEYAAWRKARAETGYRMVVAQRDDG